MSYAEHGSRIFLNARFNVNNFTKHGEYIVPRKRSEGRLKLFDSCSDLRAWSLNTLENFRYFREIVENPLPSGNVVPYDVLIENLIGLGAQTKKELALVRQQLQKYKSLRLTSEQEKQLRDIDCDSPKNQGKSNDSTLGQESKTNEEESDLPKRPETPRQSVCSSNSNFYENGTVQEGRTDDEISSEEHSDESRELFFSSETDRTDDDVSVKIPNSDRSTNRYESLDNDNHQTIIIEKDSQIVALKHEIAAKEAELEEVKEHSRIMKSSLNEKERILDSLRGNLKKSQKQLESMNDQLRQEMDDRNKILYTYQCQLDNLKEKLNEKTHECSKQSRMIEDLNERIKEIELLRNEKDSLGRKLEEMNDIIHERNKLKSLYEEQTMNNEVQKEEFDRLLSLIERNSVKYDDRQAKMKRHLEDLRSEIEIRNTKIRDYEAQFSSMREQINDSTSLSEFPTLEIRKMRCAIQDELRYLENELLERLGTHKHHCLSRQKEIALRVGDAIDELNKTKIRHDNWEREKAFMECTIEQLTMQVSASNAANEEQDAIKKNVDTQMSKDLEKIQQLIVELEPYHEERAYLIDEINCLNEAIEEAEIAGASRDNKHRKVCEEYEKHIRSLENKLLEMQSEYEKLSENARDDEDEETQRLLDEKIDEAFVITVKSSLERMGRVTADLRGAGDYIGREMAKKQSELELKEAEIERLRQQLAIYVSRGGGDQDHQTKLNHVEELKNEISRLKSELAKTREVMTRSKDEQQLIEFKLKSANQKIDTLSAQCKLNERELEHKMQEATRLMKEVKGLNKSIHSTHDIVLKLEEAETKMISLQDENLTLRDEVFNVRELCEEYKNRVADLEVKDMEAKEIFERAVSNWQTVTRKKDNVIDALQIITERLTLESSKFDEDKKRLTEKLADMKPALDNCIRRSNKVEQDLNLMIEDNEMLQSNICELNRETERLSSEIMPEAMVKKLLHSLPGKICSRIDNLKKQISSNELEVVPHEKEENKWKIKSREDEQLIEKLQRELSLSTDKVLQQENIIQDLEKDNIDLKTKLEQSETDKTSASALKEKELIAKNSVEIVIENLKNENKRKDGMIESLTRDLRGTSEELKKLDDKIRSLTIEKTRLFDELKKQTDLRKTMLTGLQQKYNTQLRAIHDKHNDSVKRLESRYDEDIKNTVNPFDPEAWLTSLNAKEMTELHRKISASIPCEMIIDSSKTRVFNDKQNHQLQHDEKMLYSDLINLRNGYHLCNKEAAMGLRYVYERRTFEGIQNKSAETPVAECNHDIQRMNFIYECTKQLKQDSSK